MIQPTPVRSLIFNKMHRHETRLRIITELPAGVWSFTQRKVQFTPQERPGEEIQAGGSYLMLFVQVSSVQSTFTPSGGPIGSPWRKTPLLLLTCSYVVKSH